MKNQEKTIREILKEIPSVDQLVLFCNNSIDIKIPPQFVKILIRKKLKEIRRMLLDGNLKNKDIKEYCFSKVASYIQLNNKFKLRNVINGTGIILHTGLGRAPIDKKVLIDSINRTYPYSNLEYDYIKNKRGERNNHINELISSLTSSETSLMVNNNAAAVLLILNTFSYKKEVLISRGELVEIGGSFRIPEVINKANCNMVEVGTTNKTHLKDFKNAINENTGLIMIAHTSNYKVIGFTKAVELKELVALAKSKRIPLFLDLGSGALIEYDKFNLPHERIVMKYLKAGVDIISFSGDKLIGGPQAGVICAKKSYIKKIHSNSMYRALRCNKFTISLMESTLRNYCNEQELNKNNLTFNLLTRDRKKIDKFGKNILGKIKSNIIKKYDIQLVDTFVQAGSGSLPIENIESKAIVFKNKNIKPSYLSEKFRLAPTPIIGYIKSKNFYIDLKAIPNEQSNDVIKIINIIL